MPPWSDVRALAESLAHGDDFITFLDVLPLQRMAQGLMHMPRPTLDAITTLHGCPHLTLGARDVLEDLLRSYWGRLQAERQLGLSVLRLRDHNKTVRLDVGQYVTLVLLAPRGQRWLLQARALTPGPGTLIVNEVEGRVRTEQRMQLRGSFVGAHDVEARLVGGPGHTALGVLPSTAPKSSTLAQTPRAYFRLTVIIEEPSLSP